MAECDYWGKECLGSIGVVHKGQGKKTIRQLQKLVGVERVIQGPQAGYQQKVKLHM